MNPASPRSMPTLSLALQGGGSHGAFTWGVLDTLLADGRIAIEGISGTSAGAVNAVALAAGWAQALARGEDPRAGARQTLARIWNEIAGWGTLGSVPQKFGAMLWGGFSQELAPTNILAQALQGLVSPYQLNPLDINPLRSLLEREIDFDALARAGRPKVFVSATHVRTGKAVIFGGAQLNAQAVMASACLPLLFQAVEIDGEHYWDGGYSVNPALSPLIRACDSADLLLVQINPLQREALPRTAGEIADRINELTFNASLLTQMRAVEAINRLLAQGHLRDPGRRMVRLHRIDGGADMQAYPASSKASADAALIRKLFETGQAAAQQWLQRHFDALGRHSTVDVRRDYLDDTWQELSAPDTPTAELQARGWRPWLARLLRRSGKQGR